MEHMRPYLKLWTAVLVQAVFDLRFAKQRKKEPDPELIEFFAPGSEALDVICDVVGISPREVLRVVHSPDLVKNKIRFRFQNNKFL